jgi:hypothetical protein
MKKSWLKNYAQDGKKVAALSPEDAAIAKVLMERNRGKNFVDRAYNNVTAPRLQTNTIPGYQNVDPRMYSTELMSYDINPDGTGRVYPEIVQRPGDNTLTYLGGDKAWDYADSTGQYITTPTGKIADMLSDKGYKKATGIPTYKEGGGVPPFVTSDKNIYNQRKQAYTDSLQLHNLAYNFQKSELGENSFKPDEYNKANKSYTTNNIKGELHDYANYDRAYRKMDELSRKTGIDPVGYYPVEGFLPAFKRPVQKVSYENPIQTYQPQQVQVAPYTPVIRPDGWYSNNVNVPIDAEDVSALYNEDGTQKYKQGGMIKRADGSYSQRGLWDNIRANAGSGKKPTKEMLKQEKKIRAKEKAKDGWKADPNATVSPTPTQGVSASSSPYYQTGTVTPLSYEQKFLRGMQENQPESVIREAAPRRSAQDKRGAIARNPMTAAQYIVRGQEIPDYFEKGDRNIYENAMDVINPMNYYDAAKNIVSGKHFKDAETAGQIAMAVPLTLLELGQLADLGPEAKAAQKFLGKVTPEVRSNYRDVIRGYQKGILPEKSKELAFNPKELDRLYRKGIDEQNTFVRGVSTNFDILENRSPNDFKRAKIALEKAGIDWKNNPEEVAKYMATRIPGDSDEFGRFGLPDNFKGLYASNSVGTAEGYTYGNGYIVKAKRPTKFEGTNRQKWIEDNAIEPIRVKIDPSGKISQVPSELFEGSQVQLFDQHLLNYDNPLEMDPSKLHSSNRKVAEEFKQNVQDHYKKLRSEKLKEVFKKTGDKSVKLSDDDKEKILQELNLYKSNLAGKLHGTNNDEVSKIIEIAPGSGKVIKHEIGHPDIPGDPYAHYIFLGGKGEQVLEPIDIQRITPDIFKNKSRQHVGSYTPGLSKLKDGGTIAKDSIKAIEKAQSGIYMPVANASTPFMPNSNRTVVQQAPSFLNGVPEGFDMNTKFGYMQYLQDSIADESRKRIVDKGYNQKDPTITLNKGNFRNAKVNTKVIDDAIASAKKKGIPLWQMMGIAGQESTLGTNRKERDSGYERPNTQRNIVSGWNTTEPVLPEDFEVYMAGHGVPGVKAIKTKKRYIGTTVDRDAAEKYLQEHPKVIDSYRKSQSLKIPKKPMSEFDYAASYLKEKGVKGYNPEDADYRNKVNARIKELSSDPAFMNYVKQKGYNLGTVQQYKNGGWLAKYEDGGDTSEGFSPSELATLKEAQANYKPAPYQDMDPAMLQQYRLMEKIATPQGRGEVIIQKAKENRKKLIEEQGIKSKEAAQYLKDKAAQQRAQEDPSMFTPSFWTEDPVTGRRPEDRLYDMGTDLQTRVFQTGNKTYDSYLNAPGFMSHMAGNLAKAPLKAKQENSVMPYVSAIGEPLAVGTVEGVVEPYAKKAIEKLTPYYTQALQSIKEGAQSMKPKADLLKDALTPGRLKSLDKDIEQTANAKYELWQKAMQEESNLRQLKNKASSFLSRKDERRNLWIQEGSKEGTLRQIKDLKTRGYIKDGNIYREVSAFEKSNEGNAIINFTTGEEVIPEVSLPGSVTKYVRQGKNISKEVIETGDVKISDPYQKTVQDNIQHIENVSGGKVYGSAKGVASANFPHSIGDYDVIISEANYKKNVEKNLQLVADKTSGIRTVKAHSLDPKFGKQGEVDFNIIEADSGTGKAKGPLAEELFRQFAPDEFGAAAKESIRTGKPLEIKYTPDELIEMTDPSTKTIMDAYEAGSYGGTKEKHILKIDKFINYGDPAKVATAQDQYVKSLVGSKGNVGHQFPIEQLSNPEVNKEILSEMGFAGDIDFVAKDPQRMQLALNDYYINNTILSRGIKPETDLNLIKSALTEWNPEKGGGQAMGAGLNNVMLGESGYGDGGIYSNKQLNIDKILRRDDPLTYVHTIKKATDGNIPFTQSEREKVISILEENGIKGYRASDIENPAELITYLSYKDPAKTILDKVSDATGIRIVSTTSYGNSKYASTIGAFNDEVDAILYAPRQYIPRLKSLEMRKGKFANLKKSTSPEMTEQQFHMVKNYLTDAEEIVKKRLAEIEKQLDQYNIDIEYKVEKLTEKQRSKFEKLYQEYTDLDNAFFKLHRKKEQVSLMRDRLFVSGLVGTLGTLGVAAYKNANDPKLQKAYKEREKELIELGKKRRAETAKFKKYWDENMSDQADEYTKLNKRLTKEEPKVKKQPIVENQNVQNRIREKINTNFGMKMYGGKITNNWLQNY